MATFLSQYYYPFRDKGRYYFFIDEFAHMAGNTIEGIKEEVPTEQISIMQVAVPYDDGIKYLRRKGLHKKANRAKDQAGNIFKDLKDEYNDSSRGVKN